MRSPPPQPPFQASLECPQTRLHALDPARLLLWIPLLVAAIGLASLVGLHQMALPYAGILVFVMVYNSLTLFSPPSMRATLLAYAAQVYATILLLVWVTALYVLPDHPATTMVKLGASLHLMTICVLLFAQLPPFTATRWAAGTLAALVLTDLPYAWRTISQNGIFDGVTLPVTLLVSYGTLIMMLRSFSTFQNQLTRSEGRAQTLHELAHHDPLTGLPNRRALERDLEQAMAESGVGWRLAVVDVDGMKKVNDSLGHAAGDDLLRRFTEGFAGQMGNREQVYRIGGDEFALLLSDAHPSAEAIIDAVTQDIRTIYPGAAASVGTAHWRSEETAHAWLSRADAAMYRYKRRGGPGR